MKLHMWTVDWFDGMVDIVSRINKNNNIFSFIYETRSSLNKWQ